MRSQGSVAVAVPNTAKPCFCNQCKKKFARRELDSHFLCETCRVIPGVRGYRDPNKRGLDSGSLEYWESTKDQLYIVRDDDGAAPAAVLIPSDAVAIVPRERRTATHTVMPSKQSEFQRWRLSVHASSSLSEDVKLCLLCLAEWGDYGTGANIFPKEETLAEALGCTRWQVRRLLRLGREWAVPHRMKRRHGARGDSVNLYQLRRPTEAKHGLWEGPALCDRKWLAVKEPTSGEAIE